LPQVRSFRRHLLLGRQPGYKVRDKRFLAAALAELAGVAQDSFEGDLGSTSLFDVAGASNDETQVLKRTTLWSKQDFVVLPLEAEMVGPIMAAVGGTVPRGLIHVQIQKEGRFQLGLYDNFAPKFMFFGPGLTPTFFANLHKPASRGSTAQSLDRQWAGYIRVADLLVVIAK
jgi:hypothetical protein